MGYIPVDSGGVYSGIADYLQNQTSNSVMDVFYIQEGERPDYKFLIYWISYVKFVNFIRHFRNNIGGGIKRPNNFHTREFKLGALLQVLILGKMINFILILFLKCLLGPKEINANNIRSAS